MINVMVVDDSAFMRDIIKDIINSQPDMQVVGEADNGTAGFEKYKELKPDLVTMDIIMANENGIQALGKIMNYDKDAKVIMVTSIGQEKFVTECLQLGAKGFIIKPFAEEQVISTLTKVFS